MSRLLNLYRNLLSKYPLRMQAIQAGALMAVGDQIAQNFVEKRKFEDIDYIRTAKFYAIGFCIGGPATYTWYGLLDKHIGSKGGLVAMKKVACDQLLFAPCFIGVLLSAVGFMQGNNVNSIREKLQREYLEILRNNYKVWPMVQMMNFAFVPLQYQVLVVQSVAVLWNSYVSYRTNRDVADNPHS
ncbi:protein Mpv17 [Diachasma alloeum]|uniref:protein Mpv17 n=1 Tax=Diachasma alloeum TaxID=454923 RepID=UPI0007382E59|nr:protein Mpv17 [Diachasma alloeum]XP_015119219.1 protein Mpv17 [Diachasma alloeum]